MNDLKFQYIILLFSHMCVFRINLSLCYSSHNDKKEDFFLLKSINENENNSIAIYIEFRYLPVWFYIFNQTIWNKNAIDICYAQIGYFRVCFIHVSCTCLYFYWTLTFKNDRRKFVIKQTCPHCDYAIKISKKNAVPLVFVVVCVGVCLYWICVNDENPTSFVFYWVNH